MAIIQNFPFGDDYSTFKPNGTWGMTYVRISGPRVPLEGVARRWLTPKGYLSWAPNAGFDCYKLLNASRNQSVLRQYQALLAAEAQQVNFVTRAVVTATFVPSGFTLNITGAISLANGGTYPLLVSASAAGQAIIQFPGN
jgi:hypothetical protein